MAWLSGWSYRKEISITGQSGAGTNYQVDFSIGDSAGGDFHLEGHCTNFPQDIEVTDNDETTLLKFWIEDITADPLEMTVKVADDLGTNQTIYIYYGKSGATTNSNGEDTFLFFDDFPGSSLDGGKWASTTGSSVGSSILTVTATGGAGSYTTDTWHEDVAYRAKAKRLEGADGNMIGFADGWGTDGIFFRVGSGGANQIQCFGGGGYTSQTATISVIDYKILDILWIANSARFFVDGVEEGNSPITTNLPAGAEPLGITTTGSRSGFADWMLVRKYIVTEPAFSSSGSEETPPITGHPWFYERKQ